MRCSYQIRYCVRVHIIIMRGFYLSLRFSTLVSLTIVDRVLALDGENNVLRM